MKKVEIIWRELLYQSLEKQVFRFTQKNLAARFKVSVSTVHQAISLPRKLHAVRVTGRYFEMIQVEKILYLWGTYRNPFKELIYETFVAQSAAHIEGQLPPGTLLTGYGGFKERFHNTPAEYAHVYCYSENLNEIKRRFPANKQQAPNLCVFSPDLFLKLYPALPLAQIFVDIWNLPEWYSKDFIAAFRHNYATVLE
ncbi:MAG: hypothetical protein HY559_06520 [Gammaproteobacteria bacterium]|nr:hypothetical protein [Gammaproteobacteria bacterium]